MWASAGYRNRADKKVYEKGPGRENDLLFRFLLHIRPCPKAELLPALPPQTSFTLLRPTVKCYNNREQNLSEAWCGVEADHS